MKPLEALVIGFPGDRATGEGDEAASDPETVVPDEHTATHAKKGESEDQTEQAANPRKSAFKALVYGTSKAAKVSPRKERRLNAPPIYAGEPTPGEGGDSSASRPGVCVLWEMKSCIMRTRCLNCPMMSSKLRR